MATRATIERIARQIERLAAKHEAATCIPVYDGESEGGALKAFGRPLTGSIAFNRARQGDRRADCERNGMDLLYRLGPSDVRLLMAQIDGTARGIPTNPTIESFEGSEH
jgi:hypothetical protein